MLLFDDMQRSETDAASYAEPEFPYMNRSARPEFSEIRAMLEDWASRYPEAERPELVRRFRSPNDVQHRSAFFELFLHELLLRCCCEIKVHPEVPNSSRKPDFLVSDSAAGRYYVEAVLVTDETEAEAQQRAVLHHAYDYLNKNVDSPDFFLSIKLRGALKKQPAPREVARSVQMHLSRLDYTAVVEQYELSNDFDCLPRWTIDVGGCAMTFIAIPKSAKARGRTGVRPIGSLSAGAQCLQTEVSLKNAITKKAGRYGKLDLPFVIALNALGMHTDEIDVMEALFGKEEFTVSLGPAGNVSEPRLERQPNGAWHDGKPRYTRVSAVLITTKLQPWTVSSAPVELWHHPWAQLPYTGALTRFSQRVPRNDRVVKVPGSAISEIFGELSPRI